jgi:hypothetical protein
VKYIPLYLDILFLVPVALMPFEVNNCIVKGKVGTKNRENYGKDGGKSSCATTPRHIDRVSLPANSGSITTFAPIHTTTAS